jgi:hypothetical protein
MSLLVLADPTYALALALAMARDELPTKRLVDYIDNILREFGCVEGGWD